MKKHLRFITASLIVLLLSGMMLSSCRALMGDPRKNCNHPKHGEYMMEQRAKNMRKAGL
ncbi:MAG: hypothetical protein NWR72_10975 [Bacteroidia bacterium]|nr:hypothetical protein [Bacteroidia bacterium]